MHFNIDTDMAAIMARGAAGFVASSVASLVLQVPPPTTGITAENAINIVTQLAILSGTILGIYAKYLEIRKNKNNKSKK